MFRFVVLCMFVCMPGVLWAACPDGFTEYLGPAGGLVRDANGNCSELCGSGISSLNTSNGYKFDLFATKNTTPAIHIKSGDVVCYADLIAGASSDTLNIGIGDTTYHANPDSGNLCPVTYTLSYSCGDGATGTPPESREMSWGDLYTAPYDAGTCVKPGYYLSGWKVDTSSLTVGNYYTYTYATDKTMVAQWSVNSYGAPIVCNYCNKNTTGTSTQYVNASYNSTFTPTASPTCTNPFNKTLDGYRVYDALGNETGDMLTAGVSTKWTWPSNVLLRAQWSGGDVEPVYYNLSYSCGDGATGTPPDTHRVAYNQLYTAPYDAGTCIKPGYYLSGWKIDSTSLTKGSYRTYSYKADKVMVAQWTANSYGAPLVICRAYCANAQTSTQYVSGKYNSSFSAPTSVTCPNRTFTGVYNVYDALGNDTGDMVSAGASATWIWPSNVQFQPNFTDDVTPYKLSYSCGDGATGTPPATRDILYGQLYTAPYDAGTCVKPGYYLSGWKIDSSSKTSGAYSAYTYTTDKTMVAQWSVNSYGAAYICDNGTTISTYLSGKYGSSYTPSTTACTAADGATFAGWRIADAYGNDTGDTVASGASFTWNYPHNIRLVAVWE